jgi:bleomycin hydrolase
MRAAFSLIIILFISAQVLFSQDKGVFKERENEFYNKVKKELNEFYQEEKPESKSFSVDFEGMNLPKSKDEFTHYWHNEPLSQGRTGTCWDFSTTSFFESEIYRIHGKKIKLSELYTAYWEFVEKARRFVREHGDSYFAHGSEANAVRRMWKKYGVVPAEVYTGLKNGQPYHDHNKMFDEMWTYLKSVRENEAWNEEQVLSTIKEIMNHYIGKPPEEFEYEGKTYTPKEFFENVVDLNMQDYIDILSLKEKPYWKKVEYPVPDNWWHSEEYYNIPLDEYMEIVKKSIREGYTIVIGGDVSEPGINGEYEVAMIPTFDIPSDYINEDARQYRFSHRVTTDDHGIHLVGYKEQNGKDWYLIKDSGSRAFNGPNKGYYFYHEDYIKLKIMDFMVHKDMVEDILKKFDE